VKTFGVRRSVLGVRRSEFGGYPHCLFLPGQVGGKEGGGLWGDSPNAERRTLNTAAGQCGFSLIEVMVASLLMVVGVIGTVYFFVAGQMDVEDAGMIRGALHCAQSKLADLQGLSSQNADLQGSPSPGAIHLDAGNPITLDDRGTATTSDDLLGYRRWMVIDVDDPANGTTQGQVDYKTVQVEVAEDVAFARILASLQTILAP
jgi:prepilin-type N-terminal cleavage/methylation domain-containing protein